MTPSTSIDAVFLSSGFEVLRSGKAYRTKLYEKELHIYTAEVRTGRREGRRSVYVGNTVNIYVESSLKTRANLTHKHVGLSGFLNHGSPTLQAVPCPAFEAAGFAFKAFDEQWGAKLVKAAQDLMLMIMSQGGVRFLRVEPEAVHLALRIDWKHITPELIAGRLEPLLEFTSLAERIDAPARVIEETKNEAASRLGKRSLVKAPTWRSVLTFVATGVIGFFLLLVVLLL